VALSGGDLLTLVATISQDASTSSIRLR